MMIIHALLGFVLCSLIGKALSKNSIGLSDKEIQGRTRIIGIWEVLL